MGRNTAFKSIGLALLTTSVLSTSAMAGGFDRGGVNIDQLFDTDRFTASAQYTYVDPRRTINNINRSGLPLNSSVDVDSSYNVQRYGLKANLADGVDCLASYSNGFGGTASYGRGNIYSPTSVDFEVKSRDYGLTCAYQFSAGTTSVGDAFARIIVGGSYLEAEGFQSRQSLLFGAPPATPPTPGLGIFSITDESYGWRAGVAYEIPDIALRASLVYNSKYDLDFDGTQDISGFFGAPVGTVVFPIQLNTQIPQSIDAKFQTGIREGTLGFLNLRWQDWSQLDVLPVLNGSNPNLALEPGFQDGYTVTAGIGQVLTDNLAARVALTWDRGTSTVSGTQSDTWSLSAGLRYDVNENVEFNIGGAVGILTSGNSRQLANSIDPSNNNAYTYDNDMLYAISTGVKFKFN